jgi:Lar family restriction alleviation protein
MVAPQETPVNALCPFCGNKGAIDTLNYASGDPGRFRIQCRECGGATKWHETAEQAWDAWNRRPETRCGVSDSAGDNSGTKQPPSWGTQKESGRSRQGEDMSGKRLMPRNQMRNLLEQNQPVKKKPRGRPPKAKK